ncbi:MAG: hypothetical protein QG597_3180, partial [Actinomycetota bacterium]|nr:hypothetical protein [Actinomycetota bacterium]
MGQNPGGIDRGGRVSHISASAEESSGYVASNWPCGCREHVPGHLQDTGPATKSARLAVLDSSHRRGTAP